MCYAITVIVIYDEYNLVWGFVTMTPAEKKKLSKAKYLFKITVVGPDDSLLESFLSTFDPVVKVDGIRIVSADHSTDDSDVRAVFMSPKHAALDILLSLTFKGANAVVIVLREPDPEMEKIYRNEIRENCGDRIPSRVCTIGSSIDDFKRTEIHLMFDELVEEILAQREKDHKAKEKKERAKKKAAKPKQKKVSKKKKK